MRGGGLCFASFVLSAFFPVNTSKTGIVPLAHFAFSPNRCYRLKKDCFSRPPAPPRVKKRPKRSRVAELEKRLNELSSQFEGAQPNAVASHNTIATSPPPQTQQQQQQQHHHHHQAAAPINAAKPEKSDVYSFEHLFPSPSPTGDDGHEVTEWSPEVLKDLDSPWPLPSESEMLLLVYREMFAEFFPFVVIPKGMTAVELRTQRPFLWKAVMLSSSIFDCTRQCKLGEELLADIGKASIVDGTRSLDMLQAVELLLGWCALSSITERKLPDSALMASS